MYTVKLLMLIAKIFTHDEIINMISDDKSEIKELSPKMEISDKSQNPNDKVKTVIKEVIVEVDSPTSLESPKIPSTVPAPEISHLSPGLEPYNLVSEMCYVATTSSTPEMLKSKIESAGAKVTKTFNKKIKGVSFCVANKEDIKKIKEQNATILIEEDKYYKSSTVQSNIPYHMYIMKHYRNLIFNNYLYDNWFVNFFQLDKIFKIFFGGYEYYYTGRNVSVYLIDTSVDTFSGRIKNLSGSQSSCNHHGNLMSKLLIGDINGWAKDTVLNVIDTVGCDGKIKLSDLLSSIEQIPDEARTKLVVFGVSGPYSNILNKAVDELSKDKSIIVTPSGNNHDISCNYSPGSARSAINVGSVNRHAEISKFSNYGSCVRMYAPGENILDRHEGTSMSAAIVSGAIAIFLEKYPNAEFEQVWSFLVNNSFWNYRGGYNTMLVPFLPEGNENSIFTSSKIKDASQDIVMVLFIVGLSVLFIYLVIRIAHIFMRNRDNVLFDRPIDRF